MSITGITVTITTMTLIIIMRVQAAMAAAREAVERGEAGGRAEEASAETQRSLLDAQMFAARTQAETQGGQNIVDSVRFLGNQPGEEPHESWLQRGGTSAESTLAHMQSLQEMTQSQMERLITYSLTPIK